MKNRSVERYTLEMRWLMAAHLEALEVAASGGPAALDAAHVASGTGILMAHFTRMHSDQEYVVRTGERPLVLALVYYGCPSDAAGHGITALLAHTQFQGDHADAVSDAMDRTLESLLAELPLPRQGVNT